MAMKHMSAGRLFRAALKAVISWATRGRPEKVIEVLRGLWLEWRIARSLPGWQKRLVALAGERNLKLNLGCGPNAKPGWVNLDLFNSRADFQYDLRRPFPLPDACCSLIYSEHLFEHFEYQEGLALLRESCRLLAPGGVLRVVVPDMPAIFKAYLDRDEAYFGLMQDMRLINGMDNKDACLIDYVNLAAYQYGEHKMLYDADKLVCMAKLAGFSRAERSTYRESFDSPLPVRRHYSLYVEAIK